MSPDTAREIFRAMGNENASMHGRGGRHPIMHRTETIDYAVIHEGELTMILDESEVLLKQGDVVVQRGASHSWANRSDTPCKILFVLIDGAFDAGLQEAFANK